MSDKPGTTELAKAAGISKSYASEIVNDVRPPSRPLAIHIFRATGWKHPIITDLTEQLQMLEEIEPWVKAA
jgi:transcriptional regulator with XRE-family HTH domain